MKFVWIGLFLVFSMFFVAAVVPSPFPTSPANGALFQRGGLTYDYNLTAKTWYAQNFQTDGNILYNLDVNGSIVMNHSRVVNWNLLSTIIPWADANVANDLTINTANSAIFRGDLNAYGGLNANTIRSFDNNSLSLQTLNTARLTVLSDGNVGINDATPSGILDVDTSAAADALVINNSSGKIGIGTASPVTLLHVTSLSPKIRLADSSTNPVFEFYEGATQTGTLETFAQDMYLSTVQAKDIFFRTLNTTKMTIKNSGNVGIATATPNNILNVVGDLNVVTSATALPTLVANTSGNVGIGVVPGDTFDVNSSNSRLRFSNANGLRVITTGNSGWTNLGTTNQTVPILEWYNSANSPLGVIDANGNVGIGDTTPSGILDVDTSGAADALVVNNSSGNVGIGTTGPVGKMHVYTGASGIAPDTAYDDIVVEGSGTTGISILSGANQISSLNFGNGGDAIAANLYWDDSANLFTIGTWQDNSALAFVYNNGSEAMRINTSGSVGIATTSPQNKLNVVGDLNVQYFNGSGSAFRVDANTADHNVSFVIDKNGNVGIGTTAPAKLLTVSAAAPYVRINSSNTALSDGGGTIGDLDFYTNDLSGFGTGIAASIKAITARSGGGQDVASELVFSTRTGAADATEKMVIDRSGSVGIATTTPQNKLNVIGDINAQAIFPDTNATRDLGKATNVWNNVYGVTFVTGSKQSMKENIKDDTKGMSFIDKLTPRTFTLKPRQIIETIIDKPAVFEDRNILVSNEIKDANEVIIEPAKYEVKSVEVSPATYKEIVAKTIIDTRTRTGLIAEEVATIDGNWGAVVYDTNNNPIGIDYAEITARLITALKEIKTETCARDITYSWCNK